MGHVVKNLPWCTIDIDTTAGRVFLQERWLYHWRIQPPLAAWTEQEKWDFHNRADRCIWAAWSNRATLQPAGTSTFAVRFRTRGVPINLDIRRVTAREHWNVTVTKIPDDAFATSSVLWVARRITLDSNDFNTRTFTHADGTETRQVPVAHEFGHAAGNTRTLARGDEYGSTHVHVNDRASILNQGDRLRSRHFQTILDELNTMIPDCTFTVGSV